MRTEITEWLKKDGCEVYDLRPSSKLDGLYFSEGAVAYVAVAPDMTAAKQLSVLAHEAGHHFNGITGDTGRDEERANRWATKHLLSLEAIVQATLAGCQSFYELCEWLGLDEDFVRTGIKCLRMIYGDGITIGEYYLHLYPIWVKNIKTGDIWPEE